jgi:hypothetical protein
MRGKPPEKVAVKEPLGKVKAVLSKRVSKELGLSFVERKKSGTVVIAMGVITRDQLLKILEEEELHPIEEKPTE